MKISMNNIRGNSEMFRRGKDIKGSNLMAIKLKNKRGTKSSSCLTLAICPRKILTRKSVSLPTPKPLKWSFPAGLVQTSVLSINSKIINPVFLSLKSLIKFWIQRTIKKLSLQPFQLIEKTSCLLYI